MSSAPKKIDPTPFTQTAFWKQVQGKIAQLGADSGNEPAESEKMSLFERDILTNRFLLGGESIFDEASLHNPRLKKTAIIRWLEEEFNPSWCRNALLLGAPGNGKTWGALAYGKTKMDVEILCGKVQRCNGAFITAYRLSEMIASQRHFQADLDALIRKKVLIVDDLGTEPSGYKAKDFQAHFEYLFSERHRSKRTTIVTSNATPAQIREMYGDRFVSRFNENGLVFESKDPDIRGKY